MKISQRMLGDSPPFGEMRLRALLRLLSSLALRRGLALGRLFYCLALCWFLFHCHVGSTPFCFHRRN